MISLEKHSDSAAFIGRLFFSSMFLLFGYGKLTGYAGTVSYMGSLGLPAPALFTVLAIIIEIGAGLLAGEMFRQSSAAAATSREGRRLQDQAARAVRTGRWVCF